MPLGAPLAGPPLPAGAYNRQRSPAPAGPMPTREQYNSYVPGTTTFKSTWLDPAKAMAGKALSRTTSPWTAKATTMAANAVATAAPVGLAIQAIQAQQALSDAQYNARRNEILFSQGQAASTRDRLIGDLRADTAHQQAMLVGDQFRTVDLGLQGVAADRAYWEAIGKAFGQETQNLQANQAKQREFLARAFGIETAQLDALLGFAGERKGLTERQLNDQHRFAVENRGLSDRQSQLTYDSSNRQAWSDATARGAVTSSGFRNTRDELLQQLGISKSGADVALREKEADIGTRRAANDLDYRSTVSDIGTRRQTAVLSKDRGEQALVKEWMDRIVENDRSNATITRGWSEANRTEASLHSLAADFGLRSADLEDRLRRGTQAANMDYAQTVAALNSALASNDATQRAAAMAIAQSLTGV